MRDRQRVGLPGMMRAKRKARGHVSTALVRRDCYGSLVAARQYPVNSEEVDRRRMACCVPCLLCVKVVVVRREHRK